MINQILFISSAYLIGSLSFGIIISKFLNLNDPRTIGSKNPGATNVLRMGNKVAAILTLLGDILKATIVVSIAIIMDLNELEIMQISLAVLLGHMYPIYYKFKGGKGVATYVGILCSINIMFGIVFGICWLVTFFISKFSSLSSLIGSFSVPVYLLLFDTAGNEIFFGIMFILIFYTHRENIKRLINKEENKTKIY